MGTSLASETIPDADRFTAIAEFDIEPEQHDPLLETLTEETERWVRDRPGFLAASFLQDAGDPEETRVVVYTRWASREDWEAFCRDPEQAVLCDKLRQLGVGESFDGRPHEVRRVVESVPAQPWP